MKKFLVVICVSLMFTYNANAATSKQDLQNRVDAAKLVVEQIMALSPSAAVVEGQLLVHKALQRLVYGDLAFQGADVPTMSLARSAYNRGDIREGLVAAIERLTYLRGLATNYGGGEVAVDRAFDYLALVQTVVYMIEHSRRDD